MRDKLPCPAGQARSGSVAAGCRPGCCTARQSAPAPSQTDIGFSTGPGQTGTITARLLNQIDDGLALRDGGHSSSLLSLSQSALSFFRSTNKAAASASAFSL